MFYLVLMTNFGILFNHLSYEPDVVMAILGCFMGLDDKLWYPSLKVTKYSSKGKG